MRINRDLKLLLSALALSATAATADAAKLTVCDFESCEIGQTFVMWNRFGDATTSKATVVADPSNPSNKVLHVELDAWNTYVEIAIPTDLTGKAITTKYTAVDFDLYRTAKDENDWKQFWVLLGEDILYADDGYPHQGDKQKWQHRTYNLNAASDENKSAIMHIGLHSEKSDYYLDNIVISGVDIDTYENGLLDKSGNNTDKDYAVIDNTIIIPKEIPLSVRTARYTEFRPTLLGEGDLNLYCGGERTFSGTSNGSSYPDWSGFTGDVHIYPYTAISASNVFYGLVINSGGKTFNPEDIEESLKKTNSQLLENRVFLHEGATLATPTGTRGARIGELNTYEGSTVLGPIKNGSNAGYFVVGFSGTDATLAGTIAPAGASAKVGIVKEGQGTHRITGNNNTINGAIRVTEGTVLLNNDAAAASQKKLAGPVGVLGENPGVYVFKNATLGGTGHSASIIDLYGNIEPGDNGIGVFTVADYVGGNAVDLRVRPSAKLHFQMKSATEYDKLNVSGNLNYWNITQEFDQTNKTPIIYLEPTEGNTLKAGDSFTLISAKGKSANNGEPWIFRIQYPKQYSWEIKEVEANGTYTLVATVTSLDYSGQGDVVIEDKEDSGNNYYEDIDDGIDETTVNVPLRKYAEALGKKIGVATPCWSYELNNYNLKEVQTIGREFNLLVSENGTKYDATEPSKGSFSYDLADKVVNLGNHYDCEVRGHTFVWHSQNPSWLTDKNGTKNPGNYTRTELLDIMKNHILKLVEHFRGKIFEWDVANEVLSDDQTTIRSKPDAYDLRPSIWKTVIGEEFLDSAFVWVRRADPSIKLYINDYGVEFKGAAKTEAYFNLVKRLVKSGVPLDGVGLQCHLDAGNIDINALAQNIARYKELGLNCIITELDLGINDTGTASLQTQAKDFAAIARVWLSSSNCPNLIIWGLRDGDSWRTGRNPLIFDSSANPKKAYYAIHKVLRQAAGDLVTAIDPTPTIGDKEVVGVRYYDIMGRQVSADTKGLVIVEYRLSDGTRRTEKKLVK